MARAASFVSDLVNLGAEDSFLTAVSTSGVCSFRGNIGGTDFATRGPVIMKTTIKKPKPTITGSVALALSEGSIA